MKVKIQNDAAGTPRINIVNDAKDVMSQNEIPKKGWFENHLRYLTGKLNDAEDNPEILKEVIESLVYYMGGFENYGMGNAARMLEKKARGMVKR